MSFLKLIVGMLGEAPGNRIDKNSRMVPIVGIELTTYRLQGGCSTN